MQPCYLEQRFKQEKADLSGQRAEPVRAARLRHWRRVRAQARADPGRHPGRAQLGGPHLRPQV